MTDGSNTATIKLTGDYLGVTFTASTDGHSGTNVDATKKGASAPPHGFIAAMSGLGGSSGEGLHSREAWTADRPLLVSPRVNSA